MKKKGIAVLVKFAVVSELEIILLSISVCPNTKYVIRISGLKVYVFIKIIKNQVVHAIHYENSYEHQDIFIVQTTKFLDDTLL